MNDVTKILDAIQEGDPQAADELLPLVYDELRKLAAQRMREEGSAHTLQATALVHEAYLRLVGPDSGENEEPRPKWDGKGHFFSAAAQAMRRILIDHARKKHAAKRGGSGKRFTLEDADLTIDNPPSELLDLDDALNRLAAEDQMKADLVQLWFFAGLSLKEAGAVLGISSSTADRYWAYARAMLYHDLNRGSEDSSP
ncbi:MAG: sigma-70 family RNA polymerase sigma factor [Planctomycetota bacterium]